MKNGGLVGDKLGGSSRHTSWVFTTQIDKKGLKGIKL